jgi:penicillin-binding protein 2
MTGADDGTRVRIIALALAILLMFGVLLTRLWFLQVLAGGDFAGRSFTNHVRLIREPAPRGRILDRNGVVVVSNRTALAIGVSRDLFPKGARGERIKARISKLLGMSIADIEARLGDKRVSPYAPVTIAEDVPRAAFFTVRERPEEFPGVTTMTVAVRTYPLGSVAAHVIGYVGEINGDELKRKVYSAYRQGDQIGRTGLERQYENWLRGEPGQAKLEVDASGRVLRRLGEVAPTPGNDLQLAIDIKAQQVAEESLVQGMARARQRSCPGDRTTHRCRAPAGAVVVLDSHTGEVIAMASAPTFDLRKFVGGVSQSYYDTLNAPDAHNPLLNRALQSAYPPGSTFKPMMAVAALQEGSASPTGRYPCPAVFHYGDRDFHNWKAGSGSISLSQALVESCDTVFYNFAAGWWRHERTQEVAGAKPYEIMQDWARRFGLAEPTGIDLPAESKGRVPDRAYKKGIWDANKKEYCNRYYETHERLWEDLCIRGYIWNPGDSINMAIGQGDVDATPLGLANAYGTIANGGRLMTPHVVTKVVSPHGKVLLQLGARFRRKIGAGAEPLSYVQRALRRVPVSGTAAFPYRGWPLSSLPMAAKTGSAEILGKQPFSWFASYGPTVRGLQYVGVGVVEEAGHGAEIAGPVVRRVMDQLYGRRLTPIVYGGRSD